MNKKNIIITIISVLILTCIFAFARTTTTDLGLVKPTWDEDLDILTDINANTDILEAFANDVLEHDLSPVLRANLDIATFSIEGVDATEFGYVDGVTSDIQTQFGLRYLKTEMDSFSEIQAIVSDKTLVNEEDICTIDANWVNTANPWADNEVANDITCSNYQPLDTALTNISALAYVSASLIKLTANDTYAVRTLAEVKTDLSLNDVTNDAQVAKSIGTAQGDLIYFTASATPTVLAKGTATQVLAMNAGATAPEWVAAGAGDVSKVGTPADSQVGVWTGDGTIEGAASLTYNGSNLQLTGDIGSTGAKITKGWFTDLLVANAIAGSITGNADTCTTASAGDAAVDFFGAGVDAVTDATTCTDIEGTLLSIVTGTLNAAIPADHITYDMMQDTTDTDKVLGRSTVAGGTIEEIACTSAGRALIDDADASAQRTTLGLVIGTDVEVDLSNEAGLYAVLSDVVLFLEDMVDDTTPELGGEMDCGAHSIGFTQQTVSYNVTTTTVDWRLGLKATMTFGAGNIGTFAFTNPTNPCNVLLMMIQDGTGSRVVTAWDADIKWVGGTAPTLTTTANGIDIISGYWNGTNYFCVASLAFATP